jgi:hypothetical protein
MRLRPLHVSRHAVGFAAARRDALWDAVRMVLLLAIVLVLGAILGVVM